jgi:cardiolipin synthase A/B
MGLSPVRRAFAILLGAAAVVAFMLMLAQDGVVLRIQSPHGAEDPEHPAYVAAMVGADLTTGNRYVVLTNGDEIFPSMLEAIESARRRIVFETYIYKPGEMADRFTQAFERAARRGVDVKIVLDAVGALSIDREHLQRLRDAGVEAVWFNTPAWYSFHEVNSRTHRKILVVDGEVGFTGGVSIGDDWKGDAQSIEHWRDTHVRVEGPVARLLEAGFYENFIESAGEAVPVLDPPAAVQSEDGPSIVVRTSPTAGSSNDLKRLYLLAVASARRTLDVATPYFVPDESSLWTLKEAVRRGVRVRILVESDETDAMPVKYASRHFYDRLLQEGIEIYEYQPTMMHAKVFVVDGIWSMFGSANFDNRSLELNDELNVAVTDRALAARFLKDFEEDLTRSRRLELETWRQRPLLKKARELFWSAFAEVF